MLIVNIKYYRTNVRLHTYSEKKLNLSLQTATDFVEFNIIMFNHSSNYPCLISNIMQSPQLKLYFKLKLYLKNILF